jgi:predicted nucleic acid-binding protein
VTTIVDASVAFKWFVAEEGSDAAREVLQERELIAPDLIVAEVCNAAWRLWQSKKLSLEQNRAIAERIGGMFDRLLPLPLLAPRAGVIACALRHPVYDCFYLALLESGPGTLVTADRRLLGAIDGTEWRHRVRALGH